MTAEETKSLLAELNEHLVKAKKIIEKFNSAFYKIDGNSPCIYQAEMYEGVRDLRVSILGSNLGKIIEFTKCEEVKAAREYPYVKSALIDGVLYKEYTKKKVD